MGREEHERSIPGMVRVAARRWGDREAVVDGDVRLTYREVDGLMLRSVRAALERLQPDDDADIVFTSGTTGRPKGVPITHGQSLHFYDAWGDGFGLRPGDRYLIVNPFFHCFGYKAGWMLSFMKGATA